MTNKNKKRFERYSPFISFFVISIISFISCFYFNWYISGAKFTIWLTISLALSAIYLGFVGTAIGEVISIIGSKLMKKLYEFNGDVDLMKYIRDSAIASVVLFSTSTIFSFYPVESTEGLPIIIFSLWIGIFISSFLYAGRIIYYLFTMLRIVTKQDKADFSNKENTVTVKSNSISKAPTRKNPFTGA